jgi:hypothetical protein
METLRLRRIQQPSEVRRLLEEFVSHGSFLPKDSYRILDPSALSPQLRRVLAGEAEQGHVWACWANNFQTWLFTCEMSLTASRERGAPVLKVTLYGEMGELKDTGTWLAAREGEWSRCVE